MGCDFMNGFNSGVRLVEEAAETRTKTRNEENPDQQMMRCIIFSEKD